MDPRTGGEFTEIESKLVVCAERRRRVVRELHELRELGPYALVERPPRAVRDRYFDTGKGDLSRLRLSLRLRSVDERLLLTFKGPAEVLEDGALARLEIEQPWSPDALVSVAETVRGWGVDLPEVVVDDALGPELAIESAGLRCIHRRAVRRIVRDAHSARNRSSGPDAEMVVDAVTFDVDGREVRHDEVEVEGKGPDAAEHVRALTAALLDRFGDSVRPWQPSKLQLGLALEALEAEGELAPRLDEQGRLDAEGYRAVLGHVSKR